MNNTRRNNWNEYTKNKSRACGRLFIVFSSWALVLAFSFLSNISTPYADAAVAIKAATTSGALLAHWTFDEGTSTTAGDLSANKYNGTLGSGQTWVAGKRGMAVNFDGVDDVVTTTYPALDQASWTMSAWVYDTKANNGYRAIIQTNTASDDALYIYPNNSLGYWPCGSSNTNSFPSNQWVFVTAVYTSGVGFRYYINGVQTGTGGTCADASDWDFLRIGAHSSGDSERWQGRIDDVRIYNQPMSAADIMALYESGQATRKAVNGTGLVGHWTFDEGTSTSAGDFSGNSAHATFSSTPLWVQGKRGMALDFDGTDDYLVTPLNRGSYSSMTAAAWFKYEGSVGSTYSSIFGGASADFFIGKHSGSSNIGVQDGAYNSSVAVGTNAWDGNWHHIAYVFSGGVGTIYLDGRNVGSASFGGGTGAIWIGQENESSGYDFNGKIDDARIYSRALSATEVQALYKQNQTLVNAPQTTKYANGLVGNWTFNGKDLTSTSALDVTGNGRHGTLTNTPAPVIGKSGQALFFNGGNEYVQIAQPLTSSSPFTISMWFYPTAINGSYEILYSGTDNIDLQLFFHQTTKELYTSIENVEVSAGFTLTSATINQWHHFVWTYDYVRRKVYVDGVLTANTADTTSLTINDASVRFGKLLNSLGYTLNGRMDEVRIYNRALSAAEAKQLYLMGK